MESSVNGNVPLIALKIWHLSAELAQKSTVALSTCSTWKQLISTLSILLWCLSVDFKRRIQMIKAEETWAYITVWVLELTAFCWVLLGSSESVGKSSLLLHLDQFSLVPGPWLPSLAPGCLLFYTACWWLTHNVPWECFGEALKEWPCFSCGVSNGLSGARG